MPDDKATPQRPYAVTWTRRGGHLPHGWATDPPRVFATEADAIAAAALPFGPGVSDAVVYRWAFADNGDIRASHKVGSRKRSQAFKLSKQTR